MISLTLFTSLLPAAIGIETGAAICFFLSSVALKRMVPVLGISLIMTVLGVVLVTIHLGKKLRGIYVIRGIGHSYLSLESVVSFIFGFFLFLSLIFVWLSGPSWLISVSLIVASILGWVTAVVIGKVYDLQSQLTWKGIIPLASPLLSVLLFTLVTPAILMNHGWRYPMSKWLLVTVLGVDVLFLLRRKKTFVSLHNQPFVLTYPHLKRWVAFLYMMRFVSVVLMLLCLGMGYDQPLIFLLGIMILVDRTVFYASGAQATPESNISSMKADRMKGALKDDGGDMK